MLGWRPWPMLGWRLWPMLGWCSVAGGVMDWTVPVRTSTEEMTFLRKTVVRNRSILNGSVCCDSDMDCGTSPDAWCREMPEICDD